MNFIEYLFIFFSLQSLLISILFMVNPKGDRLANRIFAFILILFSYDLFYSVLHSSRFDLILYAQLNFTFILLLSLYGPLFYFYLRRISYGKGLVWKDLFHSLPFILLNFMYRRFFMLPTEKKIEVLLNGQYVDYTINSKWNYLMIVTILFSYGILNLIGFKKAYRGDFEMKIWIKYIRRGFFLFTLVHVAFCSAIYLYPNFSKYSFDYFIAVVLVELIGIVLYFAFVQPSIFHRGTPNKKLAPIVKYGKSGLTEEFSLEMKEKLEVLMKSEKPFLNPEIRLDELAKMLDVSRNHTSQIINEHFSMNFFEFINYYRIGVAKQLLSSGTSYVSVTDVAFQSGFNNRISFYKAFKKFEGTSPSEFKPKRSLQKSVGDHRYTQVN
ncbi:MAG: helix-turn-helix domain-containing protein [Bacteroidota bacterium]